jgi:hypothetical protein
MTAAMRVERDQAIAWIIFDNPKKLNAMTDVLTAAAIGTPIVLDRAGQRQRATRIWPVGVGRPDTIARSRAAGDSPNRLRSGGRGHGYCIFP